MTSTCNRSVHSQCTDKHHLYHSNLTYLELASEDVVNLARTYIISHLDTSTCGQYTQSEMLWAKLQSWRMPVGWQTAKQGAYNSSISGGGFLAAFLRLGLVPGSPLTFSKTFGAAFLSTGCQLPLPCSSTLYSSSTSSMTVFCGARPCAAKGLVSNGQQDLMIMQQQGCSSASRLYPTSLQMLICQSWSDTSA